MARVTGGVSGPAGSCSRCDVDPAYADSRHILPGVTQEVREPTFLVLTALADMARHGYAVIQEVERLSGGQTKLRTGTLYAALDRLARDGLIQVSGEEIVGSRLRRYYELTASGRTVLDAESRRRSALSKEALRRLRVTGSFA